MKNPPLILVSGATSERGAELSDRSLSMSECYLRALIEVGGVPLVASCTPDKAYLRQSVSRCDGVMLSGGEDLEPRLYCTQLPSKLRATIKQTEPERDLFELLLIQEVFKQKKPLLAICRGHQLVNVAMGGTLLVDIGAQLRKSLKHKDIANKNRPVHPIHILRGSLLWSIFRKETLSVNSTHHQAIDRLADLFQPTAVSADGIIEATELAPAARSLLPWYLSVQFHPERLCFTYPEFRALFSCFVKACNSASREVA